MFDFSFSELVVVMLVALIVIGPERLPKVARTAGHLWGRGQRYVNKMKSDIAREMELEELKQLQKKMQAEADNLQHSVRQVAADVDGEVAKINRDLEQTAEQVQTQKNV
ncbi:MAG: Sec-independent protein translocase protein TatB [Gallionellaceae bacterium]|jgi:sec-independent protein translocase protein TatB|nr:Sec-independent protein translocase protein TatB [Gallionellaceae bacterium]